MEAYSADRSLKGKLRRRLALLAHRKPIRMRLETPMLSFSFDDAPATAVQTGAAILEARGLKGAYYISAGLAGQTGPMGRYATLDEVAGLKGGGHEIACHTYSHIDCGQASASQIVESLDLNARALASIGVSGLESFAYPYGDVSRPAKGILDARFRTARTVQAGLVRNGADANQLPSVGIEGENGEQDALSHLGDAHRARAWLILYTHDVCEAPSPWGCTPQALANIADAALKSRFEIVTVAEGARRLGL